MEKIRVQVDFSGISRMITGKSEMDFHLAASATVSDVIQLLSNTFPGLVGEVIDPDGRHLFASNVFSLKGERIIPENDVDYPLKDGDQLILLSLLSGG